MRELWGGGVGVRFTFDGVLVDMGADFLSGRSPLISSSSLDGRHGTLVTAPKFSVFRSQS